MYFIYLFILYVYVRHSELEMKNPMLCCCFTWIVFLELNFTFVFPLIKKNRGDRFAGKVTDWRILRRDLSNGWDDFEMRELIPCYRLCGRNFFECLLNQNPTNQSF